MVIVGVVTSAPVVVVVLTTFGGLELFSAGELPHAARSSAAAIPERHTNQRRGPPRKRPTEGVLREEVGEKECMTTF